MIIPMRNDAVSKIDNIRVTFFDFTFRPPSESKAPHFITGTSLTTSDPLVNQLPPFFLAK